MARAFRVLGRLVQAAVDKPDLRPEVGRPTLWCGMTLLKKLLSLRPKWVPDTLLGESCAFLTVHCGFIGGATSLAHLHDVHNCGRLPRSWGDPVILQGTNQRHGYGSALRCAPVNTIVGVVQLHFWSSCVGRFCK